MPRREQPLAAGNDAVRGFALDLRRLREKAGGPTYRQLSTRAHYSAAALSEAANGRKLPSLAVTLAYVAACDGDTEAWNARWRELAAEIATTGTRPAAADEIEPAPYMGLAAFQTADADRFYGRECLVTDLVAWVGKQHFVGIFGASGSGKSSVLRAGLVARLARDGFPTVVFTPGSHPIEECAVALAGFLGESAAVVRAEFAADPNNLHLRVRQALTDREKDLVVVVDQFEEVFTLCAEAQERDWLISALTGAASARTSRTRVVLGVRADFYGHCGQHPGLVRALRDAQVLVGPMTSDELRLAITEPAARAGCRVETALLSTLIAVAANQTGVLPLVSHALLETWRRRRGATLTLAGYQVAGGVPNALARTAEAVHAGLDDDQRDVTKQIFLRLVAPGDGTEDTKRRVSRDELDHGNPNTGGVLDRLADARLVSLDRDSVEITHEALIRHWPRLRDWLAADRDGLRIHRQLTEATAIWQSLDRDPGALYRGTRLALAEDWASTRDTVLTPRESDFLGASLAANAQEQAVIQGRARRLRRRVAVLAVLLLVATVATGYAFHAQHIATQQRNAALAQNSLREAAILRASNPALARQLTVAAFRLDPTNVARESMHEMFAAPYTTHTSHIDNAFGVAISPDGRALAATSFGSTLTKLWDISDPRRHRELPDLTTSATSVAFSPNGRLLATGCGNKGFRLWGIADPRDPHLLATLRGVPSEVVRWGAAAAFSADDQLLATISGPTTRLWSISDPARPRLLASMNGHAKTVSSVAFSPDGRLLATSSRDTTVRLWTVTDPARPEPLATLSGHVEPVTAMAFSPDGRAIATGSADRTTRLWNLTDAHNPVALAMLTGYPDVVTAVAFRPDGRSLAAASGSTIRWDDVAQLVLASHTESVHSMGFSPDGHTLATSSYDGTVRLWDTSEQTRPYWLASLHAEHETSFAFSSDGQLLATAGGVPGSTAIWGIGNRQAAKELMAVPDDGITGVAFSPTGNLLATPTGYQKTLLWDVTEAPNLRQVASFATAYTTQTLFSPDGKLLAATKPAGTTQLWDLSDPYHPRLLGSVAAQALAFHPDGRVIAMADVVDGTIRLWDLTDPRNAKKLATIHGVVDTNVEFTGQHAAFSPDGHLLITAGGDQTARLWDVTDPVHAKEVVILRGHAGKVGAVAFSPDGHTIATAGRDRTIRLWETDIERLAARACDISYPRITQAQWGHYFPGLDYQPPCP